MHEGEKTLTNVFFHPKMSKKSEMRQKMGQNKTIFCIFAE